MGYIFTNRLNGRTTGVWKSVISEVIKVNADKYGQLNSNQLEKQICGQHD